MRNDNTLTTSSNFKTMRLCEDTKFNKYNEPIETNLFNKKNLCYGNLSSSRKINATLFSFKSEQITLKSSQIIPESLSKNFRLKSAPVSKSIMNYNIKNNSIIRYSAREKSILDWAFKKFQYEESKKNDKNNFCRYKHDFWFDEDEEILKGAEANKNVNLADYDDPQGDHDFYRKYRNVTNTGKIDIEMNRHSKQLDSQLVDLSRERFKTIGMLEYKKHEFVKKQLRKSESLPGLRLVFI